MTEVSWLGWNHWWAQMWARTLDTSHTGGDDNILSVIGAWDPKNLRLLFNFSELLVDIFLCPQGLYKRQLFGGRCMNLTNLFLYGFTQGLEIGKWLLCENDSKLILKRSLCIFEGCFLKYSSHTFPKFRAYE